MRCMHCGEELGVVDAAHLCKNYFPPKGWAKAVTNYQENLPMTKTLNTKDFSALIDLLMSGTLDYKKIVTDLIKTQPEVFLQLIDRRSNVEGWRAEIIDFMRDGKKVDAIRSLRQLMGYGLKDAKDVIDNLQDYMHVNGWVNEANQFGTCQLVDNNLRAACNRLKSAAEAICV